MLQFCSCPELATVGNHTCRFLHLTTSQIWRAAKYDQIHSFALIYGPRHTLRGGRLSTSARVGKDVSLTRQPCQGGRVQTWAVYIFTDQLTGRRHLPRMQGKQGAGEGWHVGTISATIHCVSPAEIGPTCHLSPRVLRVLRSAASATPRQGERPTPWRKRAKSARNLKNTKDPTIQTLRQRYQVCS